MQFDNIICSPARLSIMAAVMSGKSISFSSLRQATGLANGNLHVQTRKLAEAGYISVASSTRGKRAITLFKVTELGIERFKLHVKKLNRILDTESGVIVPVLAGQRGDDSQVWS